jgi:hypothetical protein
MLRISLRINRTNFDAFCGREAPIAPACFGQRRRPSGSAGVLRAAPASFGQRRRPSGSAGLLRAAPACFGQRLLLRAAPPASGSACLLRAAPACFGQRRPALGSACLLRAAPASWRLKAMPLRVRAAARPTPLAPSACRRVPSESCDERQVARLLGAAVRTEPRPFLQRPARRAVKRRAACGRLRPDLRVAARSCPNPGSRPSPIGRRSCWRARRSPAGPPPRSSRS